MDTQQWVALYVYGPVRIRSEHSETVQFCRLLFENGKFVTDDEDPLPPGTKDLEPGVYGWWSPDSIPVAISGSAVLMTMQRAGGKDPWPPPPPPPPTPNFEADPLARQLWARHWVGCNGDYFMSSLNRDKK